MKRFLLATALALSTASSIVCAQATLTVQLDKPGAAINPNLFGIFFEDINFAADGGLYPERIKNGSFEFEDPMMGWRRTISDRDTNVGGFGLSTDRPLNANNPHFLRIRIEKQSEGMGLYNEGFRGLPVAQGAKFTFSLFARGGAPQPLKLQVQLLNAQGRPISEAQTLSDFTGDWKKYSCEITSSATVPNARLNIVASGQGALDIDMVSLFPQETFNNRPNGLRADLGQLLKDMHPGFMRFPGGCIVEGRVLDERYQWKTTIGPLEQRKLIMNRWNVEFAAPRNAPDYYESFGLGFFEFFQLCEDIGAKPLPILNCGMACQFNLAELVPLAELDPYIQDALDLVEFANGPASSTWGAKRAAMGHPEPFHLTMIGIGNEQWGQQYIERYERFSKALKAKYPDVQLVSGAGPDPSGQRFDYAWNELRRVGADLVDEHFYRPPGFFYDNVHRYDNYPRTGPKVFAGEYAAHTSTRKNNWEAALAEAALMTGLEHNGDVVQLASYAPLFANVDAWQWNPNLIWFDGLRSFGTPDYYVQKLFASNTGTKLLPMTLAGSTEKLYANAVIDERSGQAILKIVNASPEARKLQIKLPGSLRVQTGAKGEQISSMDLAVENTLDEPKKISPKEMTIDNAGADFSQDLPPNSLSVVRLTIAK